METKDLSKEELEHIISLLEMKKIELSKKIENAKSNTVNSSLTIGLCTLYVSVCALLLNFETALSSLLIGSTVTYISTKMNQKRQNEFIDEKNDISIRMLKYKKSLDQNY